MSARSKIADNESKSQNRKRSSNVIDSKSTGNKKILQIQNDWSENISSRGIVYYYNCRTRESQWHKPMEWTLPSKAPADVRRSFTAKSLNCSHIGETISHLVMNASEETNGNNHRMTLEKRLTLLYNHLPIHNTALTTIDENWNYENCMDVSTDSSPLSRGSISDSSFGRASNNRMLKAALLDSTNSCHISKSSEGSSIYEIRQPNENTCSPPPSVLLAPAMLAYVSAPPSDPHTTDWSSLISAALPDLLCASKSLRGLARASDIRADSLARRKDGLARLADRMGQWGVPDRLKANQ